MNKLLKEFGLYTLIAVVAANLTVNIIQNNYNRQVGKYLGMVEFSIDTSDSCMDGMIDLLKKQGREILGQKLNLALIDRTIEAQKEPDFERLLSATVYIKDIEGAGAGICINEDSDYYYILTAQHVVTSRTGNVISIMTRDKLVYVGEVIKEDTDTDLALIKVGKLENMCFSIVKLANEEPEIKDRVLVVGHPLGISWTLTEGIVSNLNINGYIMTTAPATFGNSGGAMFNIDGEVIGICSKIPGYAMGVPESNMGVFTRLSVIKEFLELTNGGVLK